MKRGRLRVLLGAAPGVGKTYSMLEEGRRLQGEGGDVVVAIVETHGRAATALLAEGLEVVPRMLVQHRGIQLSELDLAAVLARRPEIALVDELAHTNAPGSVNPKRYLDVEAMLAAGIDVISTVNIQHIESLNDVVQQITGVPQRETLPDAVLRAADQVEVVDLAPQALRDRLAEGNVYPAARIDAALSNYFRLGNLTALRELALLWLADEVDTALQSYRAEHGISTKWEARERVVVALTGGPEGDTLIRRGARIAARSAGGELVAAHVISQDGLAAAHPGALATQRALVEELGGSYHQVVGDDIPRALVEFARAANATQLVIGVSRRNRLTAALSGPGIGSTITRESGDIDVHIVTHSAAGGKFVLPRLGGSLTVRRRLAGFALALIGGPLLTWLLVSFRSEESITSDVLSYQLLVVVVALVGGLWPALFAALLSGLTLDYFLVQPLYTVTVAEPLHLFALSLYLVNALLVSCVVDQAARRTRTARRAAAESELLATVAGSVLRGEDALQALVTRTREAFGLDRVRLLAGGAVLVEASAADAAAPGASDVPAPPATMVPIGSRATLELSGPDLAASERRLLSVIASQIDAALEHRDLAQTASELGPLEEADRMRSALLAAVGHDLRRPLAAATTAISGLRATDITLTDSDRTELLATAGESLDTLASLVTNLLDVSRLQAGALAVSLGPVDLADVVLPALDELGLGPDTVQLDLPVETAPVLADPGLLQRAVVNLLTNAIRFSPAGTPARVSASRFADTVQLRIMDQGPGIPADRRGDVFVPFQRLGDTDNATGLGLGLALSKGFVEGMGGTLEADDTPGGGLTMVITLPAVTSTAVPASNEVSP
ncbi:MULTISPECIES: ATP-binding protein [unclassified Cryobacterium]|uniref:sensor histidine kinase n=1 Tax=unclassified Cryobacterium TaxID=2649013 RepID=UPI00106BFF45|nr:MULTISPECIES: ATP-binding protein [unclassified Cryobacterium]TFC59682.1 sensor histidine kinase KdpD [Cryobacterium sp. TMB3-1-2]TFC68119.1 sensor histidine kinase KdpD [Cryobacterium sp. TMB3-15]TFC79269.1 sensor histidine kinase KdpD [Cryobacterium sp. TMB3-10]TFD40189.1 sensor histidine kinase KdpD [Cryobacterium sp. TMB3-12]